MRLGHFDMSSLPVVTVRASACVRAIALGLSSVSLHVAYVYHFLCRFYFEQEAAGRGATKAASHAAVEVTNVAAACNGGGQGGDVGEDKASRY